MCVVACFLMCVCVPVLLCERVYVSGTSCINQEIAGVGLFAFRAQLAATVRSLFFKVSALNPLSFVLKSSLKFKNIFNFLPQKYLFLKKSVSVHVSLYVCTIWKWS